MEISKILTINSPTEFFAILVDQPEVIKEDPSLNIFRDYADLYLNGCECNKESNREKMIVEYQSLQSNADKSIVSNLKSSIGCDFIDLFLEEQHISRL